MEIQNHSNFSSFSTLDEIADRSPCWLAQIAENLDKVEPQKSAFLGMAQVSQTVFRLPGLWYAPEF